MQGCRGQILHLTKRIGDGVNQTVTTNSKGEIQIDNLMPGTYTVTEQTYDKYVPQETHRVTVLAGQTATVSFNNVLRRGDLTVTKTSEDGLVIFYDWDSPNGSSGPQDGLSDHTGIVEKVENGIIYTVEGNSGDSCRENHYPVGYYEILGYGILNP